MRTPFGKVPIFHIASMARCGETVLLRSLASHSRIHVVHNLGEREEAHSLRLFEYLKHYRKTKIRCLHPYVRPYNVLSDDVLVLKQGVWEHRFPFRGIILSRNPVSVYASLRNYDAQDGSASDLDALWQYNAERLSRWMRDIESLLVDEMLSLAPVEQFCLFYNRRMGALAQLGVPIVHYEKLAADPYIVLATVVHAMGLDFEDSMLSAHADYSKGAQGHGKTDMGAPLRNKSLYKFQRSVTHDEFDTIVRKTEPVHRQFGYRIEWDRITTIGEG